MPFFVPGSYEFSGRMQFMYSMMKEVYNLSAKSEEAKKRTQLKAGTY